MSIILHIGYGKTGTTSIQDYCWNNREYLYEQGIIYPNLGLLGTGHHNIAPLGATQLSNDSINILNTIKETSFKTNKTILISSENLIFYHKQVINELASLLKDIDIRIICYIRKQPQLIESTFLEWQKVGANYCNGEIFTFFNLHKNSFDFNHKIAPWEASFTKKQITARLYHKEVIGNDVVCDFLNLLGLRRQEDHKLKSNSNLSIIPEFSKLISIYDKQNQQSDFRKSFIDEILYLSNRFRPNSSLSLIEAYKSHIHQHYFESNTIFASKYLSLMEKNILLTQ